MFTHVMFIFNIHINAYCMLCTCSTHACYMPCMCMVKRPDSLLGNWNQVQLEHLTMPNFHWATCFPIFIGPRVSRPQCKPSSLPLPLSSYSSHGVLAAVLNKIPQTSPWHQTYLPMLGACNSKVNKTPPPSTASSLQTQLRSMQLA